MPARWLAVSMPLAAWIASSCARMMVSAKADSAVSASCRSAAARLALTVSMVERLAARDRVRSREAATGSSDERASFWPLPICGCSASACLRRLEMPAVARSKNALVLVPICGHGVT